MGIDTANLNLEPLNGKDSQCTPNAPTNALIVSCSHLRRFVTAMRYYELIIASNGRSKGSALFAEFCAESYPLFLGDYIHFTRRHRDDMDALKANAQNVFGLANCAISQCALRRRESRKRGRGKGDDGEGEGEGDDFHGDVMASAHFMIYHLREFGLRTLSRLKPKDGDEKGYDDGDDDEMECEDVEFADTMAQIA